MSVDRDELAKVINITRDAWLKSNEDRRTSAEALADAAIAYFDKHASAAPVGTVVVGSGLTAAQERLSIDVKSHHSEAMLSAASIISTFNWYETSEGIDFWHAVYDRLYGMGAALKASAERDAERAKVPEPVDISGITVRRNSFKDNLVFVDAANSASLLPTEARSLAAALTAQADSIEAKAA